MWAEAVTSTSTVAMSKLCSIGVALWSEIPEISVTTSVMCHETGMLATGTEDGTVWMWRVPSSWFDSPDRPAKPQQSMTGVFAHRIGGASTEGVSLATIQRPWDISATRGCIDTPRGCKPPHDTSSTSSSLPSTPMDGWGETQSFTPAQCWCAGEVEPGAEVWPFALLCGEHRSSICCLTVASEGGR